MALKQTVTILGRPNVGKSSLFNRLVGQRQAITSSVSGTTRDSVSGRVSWSGYSFELTDTAGFDRPTDVIETQAQSQVLKSLRRASVVIVVVDATTQATTEDLATARLALKSRKPVVLALNKADAAKTPADFSRLGIKPQVLVSAIHGRGTGDLLDEVTTHLKKSRDSETSTKIRLALLGRPNVGKSSLLNAMAGEDLAIVSDLAGTTRDLRSVAITFHKQVFELTDTAGLRRRGKVGRGVEKFSVSRTEAAIAAADVCAVIMDAEELGVAGDQAIAGMVKEAGKGLILVVNKWDAIEKDDKTQARLLKRLQRDFEFVWWAPIVFTSATTGLHTEKLLELASQIQLQRQGQIATGPLNRKIEELLRKHPPAGMKRLQPKINYVTQTGSEPPKFTFFASHPRSLHFSYPRYLENGLRQAYDFTGTPIKLEFRSKRAPR